MGDITSTSFGLVIAYLLPGLAAFYSLSFWSDQVQSLFQKFVTAPSNGGRFLLVVLISLIAGLQLSLVRWLLFEKLLCRNECLTPSDFAALRTEAHLIAYRAAVDELYRYHQFWGGMTIAIPFFLVGFIKTSAYSWETCIAVALVLGVEILTIFGARVAWSNYVQRSRSILSGGNHAERMGKG